jgi:hypothetical protein
MEDYNYFRENQYTENISIDINFYLEKQFIKPFQQLVDLLHTYEEMRFVKSSTYISRYLEFNPHVKFDDPNLKETHPLLYTELMRKKSQDIIASMHNKTFHPLFQAKVKDVTKFSSIYTKDKLTDARIHTLQFKPDQKIIKGRVIEHIETEDGMMVKVKPDDGTKHRKFFRVDVGVCYNRDQSFLEDFVTYRRNYEQTLREIKFIFSPKIKFIK